MIELLPLSNEGFEKLQRNYFDVASGGMSQHSVSSPEELTVFVERQLTPIIEDAKNDPNNYFRDIVLIDTKALIGTLWYRLHPNTFYSDMALLAWLGVEADYRGRGYAKASVKLLSQQLQPQGITRLTLEVFSSNKPAQQLYRSIGFSTERSVMSLTLD